MDCLADDELARLGDPGALVPGGAIEHHLAGCPACAAMVAALAPRDAHGPSLVGRRLGRYQIQAQLGAGAMGAVYRGWDTQLARAVAIKVLVDADPEVVRRFAAEAQAAAAIAHPNVVAVYDVGASDGLDYVVSELIDGDTLRTVLDRGRVPRPRVLAIALGLARGLAAAHAAGVIHRDLKPDNVMLTTDGVARMLDFGLAKRLDAGAALDATEPGLVLGTVGYMAPEQARGEPVDARADLFALGAIMFELAVGARAFAGASHAERLTAVLRDDPMLGQDAALGALGPIVARCLRKEPERRFQSAADLAWALEAVAREPAPTRSLVTRRAAVIGGAAAAVTGVVGWAIGRHGRRGRGATARPVLERITPLTFRQGRVWTARAAVDGASVYYGAAWEEGPLTSYEQRLTGGPPRTLALPSADVLAVSSTALALALDRRHVDGQCATGHLAVAPLAGGAPRRIAADVQDADFIPGTTELVAITRVGHRSRLEAPVGRVVLDEPGWLSQVRVSPRGDALACLRHPHPNDDRGDLLIVDRVTGAIRTVSADWSSIAGLAWSADGEALWVSAARDDEPAAVWRVTRAGAIARRFATAGRLRLHDVIAERALVVSRDAWHLRTLVAAGGGAPRDVSLTGTTVLAGLSDDGRLTLVGELGAEDQVNGVYVVPTAGGPRVRIGPGLPLALSPDGRRVLARAPQARGAIVYAIDGGVAQSLDLGPLTAISAAAWLDDATVVVVGTDGSGGPRLWRIGGGGAPVPITAGGAIGEVAVDVSRGHIAFIDDGDRLQVIDGAGQALAPPWPGFGNARVVGWRAGQVLLRSTTTPIAIDAVAPATGARTSVTTIAPPPLGLRGVDAAIVADDGSYGLSFGQELSELFVVDLAEAAR